MPLPVTILFDLDGTLLLTGGASRRCILAAGRAVLGDRFHWGPITVGTLDWEIFLELAAHCGIESAEQSLEKYKARYLRELREDLARQPNARALPGIRELLTELSLRNDVILGLLTGNYREGAVAKLQAAGLDPELFALGAFAEDGKRRADLVGVALEQASKLAGQSCDPANVIIIGDTPRDIACAKETGCLVLAVATGKYSIEELSQYHPDRLVPDLADPEPLYDLIQAATCHK